MQTARAKGIAERRVLFVHVLKNAMIPILTGLVVQLPLLFLGSLLIEKFFSIPGMGAYTVEAITSQDFATVQAMVSVSLGQHSTKTIRPFEKAVESIPNILVCYHVTGRFDYILHVVAKNLSQLGILVKERIASMPGVGKTETFLVFSEIKNDHGYPLDEADDA